MRLILWIVDATFVLPNSNCSIYMEGGKTFASGQKLHLIIKSFIQYQLIAFHVVLVYPGALKYEHMKWLKMSFVTCMYQHILYY